MYWKLNTPVCTFIIAAKGNGFALYADSEFLQSASTADALADNVYTHTSEFPEWDMSEYEAEDSLSAWELLKI